MALFKHSEHARMASILRDHGMKPQTRYWHDYVGFNFRMTNLQAAIGVAQLEQLRLILSLKENVAMHYFNIALQLDLELKFQSSVTLASSSHWLVSCCLDKSINIRQVISDMSMLGIETRPIFYPLSMMPPYQRYSHMPYPNSTSIAGTGISLPSSPTLDSTDINYILDSLSSCLSSHK